MRSSRGSIVGRPDSPARAVRTDVVAAAMDAVNPVYIPRNHLVEEALDAATAGDLEPFERLLTVVSEPVPASPWPRALRRTGTRLVLALLPDVLRYLIDVLGHPPARLTRPKEVLFLKSVAQPARCVSSTPVVRSIFASSVRSRTNASSSLRSSAS